MDYKEHYRRLIERGRKRNIEGYTETHHIVPRCMGGDDLKENLVKLTPEEHYVAHQLLVKMYPDNVKLLHAAIMMIPNRPSNKLYGWLRRRYGSVRSKAQLKEKNSQYGTRWITNGVHNRKISSEECIPNGWRLGRSLPPKFYKIRKCNTCVNEEKRKGLELKKLIFVKMEKCKKCRYRDIAYFHFNKYQEGNWSSASDYVRSGNYEKSIVSLTQLWKRYVIEYNPDIGRGNGRLA